MIATISTVIDHYYLPLWHRWARHIVLFVYHRKIIAHQSSPFHWWYIQNRLSRHGSKYHVVYIRGPHATTRYTGGLTTRDSEGTFRGTRSGWSLTPFWALFILSRRTQRGTTVHLLSRSWLSLRRLFEINLFLFCYRRIKVICRSSFVNEILHLFLCWFRCSSSFLPKIPKLRRSERERTFGETLRHNFVPKGSVLGSGLEIKLWDWSNENSAETSLGKVTFKKSHFTKVTKSHFLLTRYGQENRQVWRRRNSQKLFQSFQELPKASSRHPHCPHNLFSFPSRKVPAVFSPRNEPVCQARQNGRLLLSLFSEFPSRAAPSGSRSFSDLDCNCLSVFLSQRSEAFRAEHLFETFSRPHNWCNNSPNVFFALRIFSQKATWPLSLDNWAAYNRLSCRIETTRLIASAVVESL